VGWAGREGIYTAHEALESWRWTPDGRILGGAKRVRYGLRGPDVDPAVAALLERTFRVRFPELADLRIARHWGGPIGFTLDFLPAVGRRGNRIHAVAWAGHGLAQASYAGEMVADLLLERSGPGEALWSRRGWPLPPEPLRWMLARGIARLLEARDASVDRAVERAART
jgi:glycine/D-amino acid oxidase-like deaminating enzyme